MANRTVCWSIASTYRFWPSVFGRMVRPRRDRMLRVRTSAGRSVVPSESMPTVRRTASSVRVWPFSISSSSSVKMRSANALSPAAPVMVISLPRTCTSLTTARSMSRNSSSRAPSSFTMVCGSSTVILVWTCSLRSSATGGGVSLIVRPRGPYATCSRSVVHVRRVHRIGTTARRPDGFPRGVFALRSAGCAGQWQAEADKPSRRRNAMPERNAYPDGEPCWADATTPDLDAAQRFYAAVFGWEFQNSGPEFGNYSMCLRDGKPVAGLTPPPPGPETAPPMWSVYLASSDVDETARRIGRAGGSPGVRADDVRLRPGRRRIRRLAGRRPHRSPADPGSRYAVLGRADRAGRRGSGPVLPEPVRLRAGADRRRVDLRLHRLEHRRPAGRRADEDGRRRPGRRAAELGDLLLGQRRRRGGAAGHRGRRCGAVRTGELAVRPVRGDQRPVRCGLQRDRPVKGGAAVRLAFPASGRVTGSPAARPDPRPGQNLGLTGQAWDPAGHRRPRARGRGRPPDRRTVRC